MKLIVIDHREDAATNRVFRSIAHQLITLVWFIADMALGTYCIWLLIQCWANLPTHFPHIGDSLRIAAIILLGIPVILMWYVFGESVKYHLNKYCYKKFPRKR